MTRGELLHLVETERTNASWANDLQWWESVDKIYEWIEELEPVKEYEPSTEELLEAFAEDG